MESQVAGGNSTEKPGKRSRKESQIRSLREFFTKERDELAAMCNVSPFTLRDWELGIRRPRLEGFRRLKNAFITLAMREGMSRKEATVYIMEKLYRPPAVKS